MRHFGGQCSRFISNNTICAPPLLPQGGLLRAPKEASWTAKIASWAPGALLGSLAPSWRPFLDISGCISGLGSSPGSSLDAFWGLWSSFQALWHPMGSYFLKVPAECFLSSSITFILHTNVFSNSTFCLPLCFSMLPYVM